MSLANRVVLTGVNRGIGEGLARSFLQRGWEVIGLGRQPPDWAEGAPEGFRFFICDLADPASVEAACTQVTGPIDLCFSSAASFGDGAFNLSDFQADAFTRAFTINVVSPVLLARCLKPKMDSGTRKHIIMMSTGNASLAGNMEGSMLGYRTSKSALNQAVRNLAIEWGPEGYTCVSLNPGWVRTDMGGENAPLSVDQASENILSFVETVLNPDLNGAFVNTDGSSVPW